MTKQLMGNIQLFQIHLVLQGTKKQLDKDEGKAKNADLPLGNPVFVAPGGPQQIATSFKLLFAPFWRKFKKGSVLVIEVRYLSKIH